MKPFLISLTKAVLGLAVNASIDFSSGTLNLKGMTMSRTSLYHWFTHCLSRTILSTCWVSSCHSSLKTNQMRSEPSPGGPRVLWDNQRTRFSEDRGFRVKTQEPFVLQSFLFILQLLPRLHTQSLSFFFRLQPCWLTLFKALYDELTWKLASTPRSVWWFLFPPIL